MCTASSAFVRHCIGRVAAHWPDKSIISVRAFTGWAEEGGWWEIIALPVCARRPAPFITWWWGHSIRATYWMIIQSPFYFTYNSCLSTHFTSSFTMATKWGSGIPALSPSVCTIGCARQHTQPTTSWWCYKQMPQFPASLIVHYSKACSNEGTSEKSGNTWMTITDSCSKPQQRQGQC